MAVLYIIGGILLLLFLLLMVPVRMDIGFQEKFSLTVRYLFLQFPVLPEKEQGEEEKEKPEEKTPKGKKKQGGLKEILNRTGFTGFLQSLFQLVKMALSSGKRLVSRIKWKRFDLYLCLGGAQDAAAAAQLYGQLSAGIYSACSVLFGLRSKGEKGVTVDLDYSSDKNRVDFFASLSLRPIHVLREGFSLLIKGLPVYRTLLGIGSSKHTSPNISQRKVNGNE